MMYHVIHKTIFSYSQPVSLCYNIARLVPRDTAKQVCKKNAIIIDPLPDIRSEYKDFFGNKIMYFAIQRDHENLVITVQSEIEKTVTNNLVMNFYGNTSWEEAKQQLTSKNDVFLDALQYIPETMMTTSNNDVNEYALNSFTPGRSIFDATLELMQRIFRDFEYKPGFTTISTPVSEVMSKKQGVCQDFAHLAIACVRSVGLPARYVSGYLETVPPPGVQKLAGVDASHAWFAVFIPNVGWVDFDPTNNQLPAEQHITIGWGRDYSDIAPLTGVLFSSGQHQLSVSVDVRRV